VYSAGQTVPSTAQIRAEENNTKCVGKNDSMVCYPQASERACVTLSPLFGQGKIIFFTYGHL
jgi:hypothetical protein